MGSGSCFNELDFAIFIQSRLDDFALDMLDTPTCREIPEVIGDEMSVEMPRMANTSCRFGMVASTTQIFGMVSDSISEIFTL